MLDNIIAHAVEVAENQKLAPLLAKRTGISEPTLRKPENQVRSSTKRTIEEATFCHLRKRLRDQGWPNDVAQRWLEGCPKTPAAGLVYGTQTPKTPEFTATVDLARRIDGLGSDLLSARRRNRIGEAKTLLLETAWLHRQYFVDGEAEWSLETVPKAQGLIAEAREWRDLEFAMNPVMWNALFSLLALWDVELGRSPSLDSLEPTPIFGYLMPAFTGVTGQPASKRRDVLRFPVRRLIDLVAALSHLHNEEEWPPKPLRVKDLVVASELAGSSIPATSFIKWRRGDKHLSWRDFEGLWLVLFPARRGGRRVHPVAPLYFAATIFQFLLVKNISGNVSLLLMRDHYECWWGHHDRRQQAKDNEVGNHPWPAWLTDI